MIPALWLALPALIFPIVSAQETTVRDSLGRTVSVPARVRRVLSLQPEVSRIIVALGAGSSLVGRDDFVARFDHLFPLIFPGQAGLPVVAASDGFPNLEMVMRLNPDLIFASPSEAGIPDMLQKKSGKPVLAFSSMGRFEDLMSEIRWVGAALGRGDRAARLTDYAGRTLERVRRATADVPRERRPRVYMSFWGSITRTPVSYDPVTAAGGRNLAQGLLPAYLGTVATEVSLEKVLAWDPEIILLHGNYLPEERTVTVPGILEDPRLRSVQAVKNRRVFYTFGFWYWWDPALVLVETLMLAKLFHPELFRDLDIVREGNAVFKMFYGLEGGFDILRRKLGIPDGPWR